MPLSQERKLARVIWNQRIRKSQGIFSLAKAIAIRPRDMRGEFLLAYRTVSTHRDRTWRDGAALSLPSVKVIWSLTMSPSIEEGSCVIKSRMGKRLAMFST